MRKRNNQPIIQRKGPFIRRKGGLPQRVEFVYGDKNKKPFTHVEYIKKRSLVFYIKTICRYVWGKITAHLFYLGIFLRVISNKEKPPAAWYTIPSEKRTRKDGADLTKEEAAILFRHICPDCGSGLLKGPEGAGSVNVYCANKDDCGSRYNLMGYIMAERINDSKGAMTLVRTFSPHRGQTD